MNQQQAQDMLAEIEQTQQRSERFLGYWRRGAIVQMWGVVWIIAHLGAWLAPAQTGSIWMICDLLGAAGTLLLRSRGDDSPIDRRLVWAGCIVLAFGVLGTLLIGKNGRAIDVFWTCLVMTGYMLHGLWSGLRWTVLGAAVMVVSLLAYFGPAPWFNLVMAAAAGGGLLLGGTWLRHAR